jgi:hypothetical protein
LYDLGDRLSLAEQTWVIEEIDAFLSFVKRL